MSDKDFERIKAHFMEDSAISFPDFVSLREDEADVLIARITSITDKGTLRRLYQSTKKGVRLDDVVGSGITEKTTQDAQEVYDCLMDSNVLDGVLRLPEGAAFPIAFLRNDRSNVGVNVVLVRDISKHLCEMVDWIRDGGKVYGLMKRGLIMRGPPGDGKSFTSQYLIWYYVKRRVIVVYEDVSGGVVWVFRSDGQSRWFTGTADLHTAPELLDSKTVFIHDADANCSGREPVEACKATLVAFAPTNDRFLRQTERGPVVTIGFVTPTAKDVYKANRVFGVNLTQSELNGRIDKYGCHLLWLFDKSKAAVEATLAQAIDKLLLTDSSIDGVLHGVGLGVNMTGESAPTVLFSTAVKPELEEAFNSLALGDSVAESESESDSGTAKEKRMAAMFHMYRVGNIMWSVVSEHVYGLIMEKARDRGQDFANKFIRDMSNNRQLNSTAVARVISDGQHPNRKNGSKCHFSTMAAGFRNLHSPSQQKFVLSRALQLARRVLVVVK